MKRIPFHIYVWLSLVTAMAGTALFMCIDIARLLNKWMTEPL